MKAKQTADTEIEELNKMLKAAKSICIFSHSHIDPDAICSQLLFSHIAKKYFGKSKVSLFVQEEEWPQFRELNLEGIDKIINLPLDASIPLEEFDLVVLVDNYSLTRDAAFAKAPDDLEERLVVIDHHTASPESKPAVYINEHRSSAVEQLYRTFSTLFPDIAQDETVAFLTQVGIIADTSRFLYGKILDADTFYAFGEVYREHPVNIEDISTRFRTYSKESLVLFNSILKNLTYANPMAYSYITPSEVKECNGTSTDAATAKDIFLNMILRSIEGIGWGFLVYPTQETNTWKVSFRSEEGTSGVLKYAQELGGGGHLHAAGADVTGKTAVEVLEKVLSVID